MNQVIRGFIVVYSFLLAVISVIFLYSLIDDTVFGTLFTMLSKIATDPVYKWVYFSVLLCVLLSAIWSVSFVIMSGRLSKTRIRQSEIGSVDIGVDAIESIALNSAKSAQVGIKSAKAFVSSAKDDSIKVYLSAVLYSNVEIPAMMAKVQDRIKKDIERYTGISVESVSIKVSRVEHIVAKVER